MASVSRDIFSSRKISSLLSWTSTMGTNSIIGIVKEDDFLISLNSTHHMKALCYSIYLVLNLLINQLINLPGTILNVLCGLTRLILYNHDLGSMITYIFRLRLSLAQRS